MTTRTRSRKAAAPKPVPQESTLLRWLKDRRITEVECLVPDITGNARGKIIPADKFSHDYGTRLPEGIFGHDPAPGCRHRPHGALGDRSDRAGHP
jgi:glutamine synthetase